MMIALQVNRILAMVAMLLFKQGLVELQEIFMDLGLYVRPTDKLFTHQQDYLPDLLIYNTLVMLLQIGKGEYKMSSLIKK